jgi:hypothetical protein
MSITICPSCGTPAQPGAIFCDNCGFDLRTVTPSPQLPQAYPPAGDGETICPVCKHQNVPGALFCENCGSQLGRAASPQPVFQPPVPPPAASSINQASQAATIPPAARTEIGTISGHLVILESGITLPIPPRKTTVIIGREDPVSGIFPDINLDPYGGQEAGVGRRHAQLSLQSGQLILQDLNSVNGTFLNKQRITPQQSYPLNSGDEIRLGKMALSYSAG